MDECVTGQVFDRPSGVLPAWWIVNAILAFITSVVRNLEATVGDRRTGAPPRFLTPLADPPTTPDDMTTTTRTFQVDRQYEFEFSQHLITLSDPDDFKIDASFAGKFSLSSALDGQPIKVFAAHRRKSDNDDPAFDGREYHDRHHYKKWLSPIWSFDVWHESLYPLAVRKKKQQQHMISS